MFLFHKNQTKREAFGQMFTEMYPRMVRYASQLMGDGEEARDIVSEVMEQAWKHFDQLDEADRGGWIYTAVRLPQPDEASASGTGQCESTLRSDAGRCKK